MASWIPIIIALLDKFGPVVDKLLPVILDKLPLVVEKFAPVGQGILTGLTAFMQKLGISPAAALKAILQIQFKLRAPTPEEEAVMFERGMQKADENHDFPYVMGD